MESSHVSTRGFFTSTVIEVLRVTIPHHPAIDLNHPSIARRLRPRPGG